MTRATTKPIFVQKWAYRDFFFPRIWKKKGGNSMRPEATARVTFFLSFSVFLPFFLSRGVKFSLSVGVFIIRSLMRSRVRSMAFFWGLLIGHLGFGLLNGVIYRVSPDFFFMRLLHDFIRLFFVYQDGEKKYYLIIIGLLVFVFE